MFFYLPGSQPAVRSFSILFFYKKLFVQSSLLFFEAGVHVLHTACAISTRLPEKNVRVRVLPGMQVRNPGRDMSLQIERTQRTTPTGCRGTPMHRSTEKKPPAVAATADARSGTTSILTPAPPARRSRRKATEGVPALPPA